MAELELVELLDPEPSSRWSIRQIRIGDTRPVEVWLEKLGPHDAAAIEAKLHTLLSADPFPRVNSLKHLQAVGDVWEVVIGDYRLLGFRQGMTLVLTNGFRKRWRETPPACIKECQAARDRYLKQEKEKDEKGRKR